MDQALEALHVFLECTQFLFPHSHFAVFAAQKSIMMLLTFKHFLISLMIFASALAVCGEDQSGFISIDCGLPNVSNYTDPVRGLNYTSDAAFIDTGKNEYILPEYQKNYARYYQSLRSFPEGDRNCYKVIGIIRGGKYMIRALFVYGNYDKQGEPPAFDLYLGTDMWDSVIFTSPLEPVIKEIIHVPRRNYVHVCLAKTGDGIPFISSLEFRPLFNTSYQAETGYSLLSIQRIDAGSTEAYRYGDDIHDRFWTFLQRDDWTNINTSSIVDVSGTSLEPPPVVMRTAAMPKTINYLDISWQVPSDDPDNTSAYFVYMHFAEVKKLQANQSRAFEIFHNGEFFYGPLSPAYLRAETIYSPTALIGGAHSIKISKTPNSTLPPIINAWEVYVRKEFPQSETDQQDANAMTIIKSTYGMKRNWQGDPCLPKVYLWEGIECSYDDDKKPQVPRVISLDLSSSGLTSSVYPSISNLTEIQTLNLENNNLGGSVPVEIEQRLKDGLLSLRVCGNPNLSSKVSCKEKKKSVLVPVLAASVGGAIILLLTAAAFWFELTRKRHRRDAKSSFQNESLDARKRHFSYSEILTITDAFERILGEGGFGKVYYGQINNTQVAVKVNLLMRVHHKNLTSLVGYCNDEKNISLIYEYMANGNLQQHLSGSNSNILKWEDRLLIATDAAHGLEYLHYGCKPPIIHRDVKTTNILLNESFQAKLSDFGLSRIIPNYEESHVSTVVAGTPGYFDPEYYMSNRLNEKSDVYSFGVVLLEIITGRPAISKSSKNIHLSQWVKHMLQKGNIKSIVDPRLEENFDVNSAWKIVEIAMNCVSQYSAERPTMSQVVGELKESLEMGLVRTKERFQSPESRDTTPMIPLMSINFSAEISTPSAR
ncbi:Putative leucine-rich repeat receptor-like protein kinase [Morus notabilis]|uniref:Putative leucine-rich repeat receptor-like protein kinase n=1 Tax=Morus notabilis TaxID=981085 RepID=W9REN1_9ROSA|nr:Putative leucine-rich repeat receptor-like protein kinase [Morus notabilis]